MGMTSKEISSFIDSINIIMSTEEGTSTNDFNMLNSDYLYIYIYLIITSDYIFY